MAASLTLYVDYLSQPARALSLLCRVINAPHNENVINLLKGEHLKKDYAAVNPFKKIPAVKDGNTLILESCAGLRYIASKYDSSGKWYPQDLDVRCKVDEYLDWQHHNTRAHGMGFYRNKVIMPMITKKEADMKVVNEHKEELGRVEKDFVGYFLNSKPFITGDNATIADLLAACEFEQPIAAGYDISQPVKEFLERVRAEFGADYDELHKKMRGIVKN